MILSLIPGDDPRLHQPSMPIDLDNPPADLDRLIADMFTIMNDHAGVGLAAPQIGLNIRLFVLHVKQVKIACLNPSFEPIGDRLDTRNEGCLSYPGQRCLIERAAEIRATYWTPNGVRKTPKLRDWLATAFQHETDHLDGVTMFDHMIILSQPGVPQHV